jgi:hypothetical protein
MRMKKYQKSASKEYNRILTRRSHRFLLKGSEMHFGFGSFYTARGLSAVEVGNAIEDGSQCSHMNDVWEELEAEIYSSFDSAQLKTTDFRKLVYQTALNPHHEKEHAPNWTFNIINCKCEMC